MEGYNYVLVITWEELHSEPFTASFNSLEQLPEIVRTAKDYRDTDTSIRTILIEPSL